MPSIKITEISYQNNSQTGEIIKISGKAPSREVLLSFRRALEDDAAFSKVDLPISNFCKRIRYPILFELNSFII